jgi:hypothetical protein
VLYVIVAVPPATAVTIPDDVPTVATPVLLLLHIPPETLLLNVVVKVWHTDATPEIVPGTGVTLMDFVTSVPQPVLYVIVAVPALTPLTIPDEVPTDAIAELLVLHTPPVAVLLNVVVALWHTVDEPAIDAGVGVTVIACVAEEQPKL